MDVCALEAGSVCETSIQEVLIKESDRAGPRYRSPRLSGPATTIPGPTG